MAKKPDFGKGLKRKTNVSSVLAAGASSNLAIAHEEAPLPIQDAQEPERVIEPTAPRKIQSPIPASKQRIDSRKKKLSHSKVLFEYHEKREIDAFIAEIGDRVGHKIQFSVFTRGLLLAAMASKDEFLNAAERIAGLERPSNGDVEAFREYEAQIGQMIFDALRLRGNAPKRG